MRLSHDRPHGHRTGRQKCRHLPPRQLRRTDRHQAARLRSEVGKARSAYPIELGVNRHTLPPPRHSEAEAAEHGKPEGVAWRTCQRTGTVVDQCRPRRRADNSHRPPLDGCRHTGFSPPHQLRAIRHDRRTQQGRQRMRLSQSCRLGLVGSGRRARHQQDIARAPQHYAAYMGKRVGAAGRKARQLHSTDYRERQESEAYVAANKVAGHQPHIALATAVDHQSRPMAEPLRRSPIL